MYEAMEPLDTMSSEELVRLWGHEALRLFQDRLIDSEDKEWCNKLVDNVAARNFPGVDVNECLKRPILYSQWIKKTYQSTDREVLREFVAARLKVFYEEELDVPLVIFDEVLDHVLRIDNVLRHPMGHLLLVGESGTGKTVLTKFVAWMNGLSIFQIKANSRYTLEQFDDDLRSLLRRVGVDGEKICFIFDESNALSSAFLERMNALLASGEIPGLFEGDERTQLMSACRESFNQREGLVLDSEDELYRRFTRMIQRNLHVVFTMNPASSDFENRCTTSPALFNRCVVDWFGTWSTEALAQVAHEFTRRIDTGYTEYDAPPLNSPETLLLVKEVMKSEKVTLNEALVAALVTMHGSAKTTVIRQGKTSGRQHYLSPRDFLDLIHKFTTTEEEKRSALEDQQSHVRTGLQKLLETQDQVAELNKDLNAKNEILRVKDLEANQKLSQMVEKQNEAEQRKVIAESLTVELQQQNEEIRIRKETVERELSEAEPALISAKQSVQNIRKSQLDEVRALARPPKAVQLTMEMVCVMIGETNIDWAEIRKVIRRDDFIATVVNFDPLSLTPKQIKNVQDSYLSNSEVDYAAVDRASKACGPLYQWASSQIKYATILKKIKPLRDEMAALELKSQDLTVRQQEAVVEVGELEGAIQTYKSEYAAAIRETEIIRGEMQSVSKRVSRANALLASLQEEKIRWEATALSFDQQMSTLIGDCLLSAAFLTYAGIFDHKLRARLMLEWSEAMESMKIPFRSELDMISYLSKPTDQLSWIECGLPNDSLAIQNAILLERYNRFPLVIDPSGQAMKFLLKKFSAQKMVLTSFLDSSFMKTLASAIRFGTPLLVQDVESLDPVLNPVLNRELQRTGGRTLIRLGNEDIDFSPKFMVILLTRNPLAKFAPDLCSRVTTVNFTITPASLESQVLSEILKSERPDVDKRRSDVLRLQGEQNAKLRELQDTLLDCISQVQGAILDDDIVINTLENIKAEAGQLHAEVSRTSEILEEVKAVSNIYLPLAAAVSNVYFTLESLAEISFLYQYSLQFFLTIVANVLRKVSSSSVSEMSESAKVVNGRVRNLKSSFFNEIIRRVLPGLRYEDKLVFLVRTAQIATHDQPSLALTDAETDFLTKGSSQVDASAQLLQKYKAALPDGHISDVQAKQLLGLGLLPSFAKLSASFSANTTQWIQVMEDAEAEKIVPVDWLPDNCPQERATLLKALVIRALRPERVLVALEDYISAVFDNLDFDWRDHSNFNLKFIVENDSSAAIPLMLCSQPGQDASGKVDALSSALDKRLLQVSMGSAEGFAEAEKIIAQATKTGSWVLLRNVHLCTEWLGMLEKKLYGMSFHESFRLFLTCEIHDKLPTALLRRSEVMIFESSSGMKANLQRFFMSIPSTRIDRQPAERGRLYGLLAWFNAVVQERLRYAPLGWTKRYEFSESDLACSLDVIDQWVDEVAGQRAHIDPEQLPWQALRTLISESLYGGRVDHSFDQVRFNLNLYSYFLMLICTLVFAIYSLDCIGCVCSECVLSNQLQW
jgi:dynein heavy chain 1